MISLYLLLLHFRALMQNWQKGWPKITKQDKAKIFGLNAAKLYNVNVKAKRNRLPADAMDRIKVAYLESGGQRSNAAWGWVRADD